MVMPLGALIALALPLAAKASFVCDAAAVETQPAESLLRGHHLTTLDYAWPLFATKNASAPSGWSGLDIEILDKLSSRLGFTYDVKEMTTLSGESWGAMLERMTLEADLVLSYWSPTSSRMNSSAFSFLYPHIDYSGVLVVRPVGASTAGFGSKLRTFFQPFSYALWASLIGLVLFSGMTDWLLERENGGRITQSFYEYFAGTRLQRGAASASLGRAPQPSIKSSCPSSF